MANANTNPGKANTNPQHLVTSTQAVLQAGVGSNWGTMVALTTGKAYSLVAIQYSPTGQAVAYTVSTQAGLLATVPASAFSQPYTGYCKQGLHYGASKLATGLGMVNGLNRYTQ